VGADEQKTEMAQLPIATEAFGGSRSTDDGPTRTGSFSDEP